MLVWKRFGRVKITEDGLLVKRVRRSAWSWRHQRTLRAALFFQGFSRLPALLLMLPLKASVSFQELYELHFLGGDALL